ncbi:MAG: hypothetical protein AAF543_15170 [Pseudomonadota bacterium]
MNDKHRGQADELPATAWRPASIKVGGDPLAFPKALAGTWPAPDDSHRDALQHVAALDALGTACSSLARHTSRSVRSAATEAGAAVVGRTDSQGRMDLITMLTAKLKDIVNPVIAGLRPLTGSLARSRS